MGCGSSKYIQDLEDRQSLTLYEEVDKQINPDITCSTDERYDFGLSFVTYYFYVTTSDRPNAGSDANISIVVYGSSDQKGEVFELEESQFINKFSRGQTDRFVLRAVDKGNINEIRLVINSDYLQGVDDWLLDRVEIESAGCTWLFVNTQHVWLKGVSGSSYLRLKPRSTRPYDIWRCAELGQFEAVLELVVSGETDINEEHPRDGLTALQKTLKSHFRDNIRIVKLLVEYGADLEYTDRRFQNIPTQCIVMSPEKSNIIGRTLDPSKTRQEEALLQWVQNALGKATNKVDLVLAKCEISCSLHVLTHVSNPSVICGIFVLASGGNESVSFRDVINESFTCLESLTLINSCMNVLPKSLFRVPVSRNLSRLIVPFNRIQELPEVIHKIENLEVLNLSHNLLRALPASIGKLQFLKVFLCNDNKISTIPDEISKLKHLYELTLHCNEITKQSITNEIANYFLKLSKRGRITLHGNKLDPESLALHQDLSLRRYMYNYSVKTDSVKLLLVGEIGAGKTTLLQALGVNHKQEIHKQHKYCHVSKLVINDLSIRVFDYKGEVDSMDLDYIDITKNTLVLLVFDLSDYSINTANKLKISLQRIFQKTCEARVILVGTHADCPQVSTPILESTWSKVRAILMQSRASQHVSKNFCSCSECLICQKGFDLQNAIPDRNKEEPGVLTISGYDTVQGFAHELPHVVGYFEVGSGHLKINIEDLRECIYYQGQNLRIYVPRKFQQVAVSLTKLLKDMKSNSDYKNVTNSEKEASLESYKPILKYKGENSAITLQSLAFSFGIDFFELEKLTGYLRDTGLICYYSNNKLLKEFVFLDPDWFYQQLSTLWNIFGHCGGFFKLSEMWEQFPGLNKAHVEIFLQMFRSEKLCFPVNEEIDVCPARLPPGSPNTDIWPILPEKFSLQITYQFQLDNTLPESIMGMILARSYKIALKCSSTLKPLFTRSHLVFLTQHKSDDNESATEYYRVHFELLPAYKYIRVTIRGENPGVLLPTIREHVSDVTSGSTVVSIVCPTCVFLEKGYSASLFSFESGKSQTQTPPICSLGHAHKSRESINRGAAFEEAPSLSPNSLSNSSFALIEEQQCPRLFIILPLNLQGIISKTPQSYIKYFEYRFFKDAVALHLLCECPYNWHLTSHPGYVITKPKEMLEKHFIRLNVVAKVLKGIATFGTYVSPTTNFGGQSAHAGLSEVIEFSEDILKDSLAKFPKLKHKRKVVDQISSPERFLDDLGPLHYRELAAFLEHADSVGRFGGLVPSLVNGKVLWMCEEHSKFYRCV